MKKVVLIIILFFSFFNYVKGETYYGEYRLVSDIGSYTNDLLKIETTKLYNTYKNNYIDMGYMIDNSDYIKDENDYKEDYTNINENELGDEYIKIKTNDNKTTSIIIDDLDNDLLINEIEIYNQDKKIYFDFLGPNKEVLKKIKDTDLNTYINLKDTNGAYITLYNSYKISDITIMFYTSDIVDSELKLILSDTTPTITLHKNKNKHIITFNNDLEDEIIYEFKGFKKLYRYFKEEKEILNNYVETGDNIVLEDYIEINDYYIRDKLVLKDNIIIESKSDKITDFIEYSSNEVNINCNIDYSVNGIYNCSFLLNDIFVEKDVTVNILDINEISEEKIELKEQENIVEEQKEKIIEQVIEEPEDEINELDNNIKTEKKIKKLNNIITPTKVKIDEDNNKEKLINIIKYIIIINLIFVEIILFIKKKKK